ncbi:hypothetical protein GCM10023331_20610 [Algivirga pacifica]|uniref:Ligand-binding SRPBCC domain-containing protein n=2 Tax=Algivirga pacifica TaxID=1162670 RepID=A0ABP9DBK6_9BACT
MHFEVATQVKQPYEQVWKGFNQTLFNQLAPPFPKLEVKQFEGCETGDRVALSLDFLLFRQNWISVVTEQQHLHGEIYFVDKGDKLPLGLTEWKHKHRLIRHGEHTVIVDDVTYTTGSSIMDLLLFPAMYGQFLYRKPIYKKVFAL